ncbi:hypothetical protein HanHA300_Chr09g0309391 [Helianthus annuus]|nr:hypothetical protein HanHA300_Chr09g0309391 [Helianthus annuus]KAJ0892208.1 hypothetical protein HanPSC8_Chr09g0363181 [Helianthus annuus]
MTFWYSHSYKWYFSELGVFHLGHALNTCELNIIIITLVIWLTRYVIHHSLPFLNAFLFPFQIIKVAISTYLPEILGRLGFYLILNRSNGRNKKISSLNGSKDFLCVIIYWYSFSRKHYLEKKKVLMDQS